MKIIREPGELQQFARACRKEGRSIGLVPTMGFLHAGHLALIDRAREAAEVVIVSIFVNPTQFAPNEDLAQYPRSFEADCKACEEHGAAVVFAPADGAMYAPDHSTWVSEERLSRGLCGRSRPVHFRGVCTVVTKLFHLALPDVAVFGQKDAQQALIIRKMVRDLNFPLEVVVAPLVRDADGVALSSRNRYLSKDERQRARSLSQSLTHAAERLRSEGAGKLSAVLDEAREAIAAAGGKIDYLDALDAEELTDAGEGTGEVLLAGAVYFGTTRLIDNMLVKLK